jgi:hypothetical protein
VQPFKQYRLKGFFYLRSEFRLMRNMAPTMEKEGITLAGGSLLFPTTGIIERYETRDINTQDVHVMYRVPCVPWT